MSRTLSLILLALFILSLTPRIPLSTAASQPVTIKQGVTYHTIDTTTNNNDFNSEELIYRAPVNLTATGASETSLSMIYVTWDLNYLYIGVDWAPGGYTESFGIAIDANPGNDTQGYGAVWAVDDNRWEDCWQRQINQSTPYLQENGIPPIYPEYLVYFYYDGSSITSAQLNQYKYDTYPPIVDSTYGVNHYDVWNYGAASISYSPVATDHNGSTIFKVAIPWSLINGTTGALNGYNYTGKIAIALWIAGGNAGDSAVSAVPLNPLTLTGGNNEWSDPDVIYMYAVINVDADHDGKPDAGVNPADRVTFSPSLTTTVTTDKDVYNVAPGGTVDVYATVTDQFGNPLPDVNVTLLDSNSNPVTWAITDLSGTAHLSFTAPSAIGTYTYTVEFPGHAGWQASTKDITVQVGYQTRIINFSINATSAYLGSPLLATGQLQYYNGSDWLNAPANQTIEILLTNTSTVLATGKTNDTGGFSIVFNAPTYIGWNWEIKAHFPGNSSLSYGESYSSPVYLTTYGSRYIDANPGDWVGVLPPRANMWNVSDNELVWRDAVGDTRNDVTLTEDNINNTDITEFRVTTDEYYIYFLVKFKNLTHVGTTNSTILDIAIDRDQAKYSGQSWLPGYSDTKANSYAYWEYALRISLAKISSPGTYEATNDWGAAFYITDQNWNLQSGTGAWFSVSLDTDTIEIAVPWDQIGGAPAVGDKLRFTVISGLDNGNGNFYDLPGSNAVDAVTGYDNTADDLNANDQYADYYLTVQVQSGYQIYPGSVIIYWISPTPANGSHVAANTPLTLKIYSRDSLYNKMSHFIFNLVNVTSGKVIAKSEADGLGYATFTISLPVGEHHLKVTFNGTGRIPYGESDELVLYAEPIYQSYLTLSYKLVNDADGNGYITPGDTVRFTVNLTYYNSTDGKYYPLSGANVTLNSTEAGVNVTLTTGSDGIATYDWVVPKLGTPKFLAFEANYTGNATATETPRFSGSADYVSVPYYIARIVDGNITDWTGTLPATTPGISASGMEMIITDPTGDERKEYKPEWNWPHVADLDIKQVRLLIDNYTIYGMAEFAGNVSPYKWLAIAIDVYPFNDTNNYWILEDTAYGNRLGYVMPGTYDEAGKIYALSWDYVLLIKPGSNLVLLYINTTYAYKFGEVKSLDNGGTIEFYFPLYKVNLTGIFLGKQIRVWAMTFADDYGGFWNPAAYIGSPVQPRVYDIAGVTGTINVEVYDTDANAANDVFPYSDHWIETGFEFTLDSTGKPSLPATTTVNAVTVVYHADNISIGEVGPVALIVDNHEEGHWIELKDHDTGALITSGITALNGIARLGVTFSTRGLHTVDVYVDGTYMTSFTVNVTGYAVTITIDKIEVDLGAGTLHVVAHATYLNGTELPLSVANLTLSLVYMINDLNASIAAGRPVYVLTSYEISLGTYTTNATGYIDTTIALPTPPAGYPEGGYVLKITYAGNETFAPAETHNAPAEGPWFIPVFNTLPTVTWTLTGTDTGVYIGSGELLFKDTAGDENTKVYWSGGHANYLPNPGAADNLYVRMKIAGNYLVVEAQYNYNLSAIYSMGATAPFLVIGLDTTPADTTDGVDSYLWLPSSYAFGFATPPVSPQIAGLLNFYKENTPVKYTHALVITPVEGSRVAESYVVWLVTVSGGRVIAEPVGVLEVVDPANGVMRAYIPLSVLGITTTGDVRVWVASGAEYVGGFIWGAQTNNTDPYYDHTMVFDIPGYPVTTLNTESAKYNWSLLVTLDPTNGFTKIYGRVVPVTLPTGVDEGKLYVGPAANHTFTMRLLGSESDYRLIGLSVTLNYNTTTHTGTTGTDGLVTFQFQVPNADAGKNVTITFTGTTPLEVAAAPTYNLHVLYYTRIVNATMTWYDLDHDGFVSRGDKLSFYTKVEVFDENGNWVPMAGIKVSFWVYSTPYLLGSNTTDNNGVAIFNYTVTGNEGIVGTHNFVAQAGDNVVSGITSTVVTGGANLQVFMQPAPEPPILPVILLAAILLFIIIKKRK